MLLWAILSIIVRVGQVITSNWLPLEYYSFWCGSSVSLENASCWISVIISFEENSRSAASLKSFTGARFQDDPHCCSVKWLPVTAVSYCSLYRLSWSIVMQTDNTLCLWIIYRGNNVISINKMSSLSFLALIK